MNTRKNFRRLLSAALSIASLATTRADIPAFPGATGPGAVATGGRGGDVYHVTRLDVDKEGVLPGSLQYGINSTPAAGRTIVFDVGGTIFLSAQSANDTLRYNDGNLTIAGQTAPGTGITIAGTGTKWTGSNVILRNITIIPGKESLVTFDAFSLQVKNSILDHVSALWFTDEGISISDRGETSTVQFANISEGLNYAGHSFGSIITTEMDGTRYSFNHNLYAHNGSRMPRIGAEIGQTGSVLDFTNNILYNWSSTKVGYGGRNQPCSTNFINNYYINGVNNQTTNLFVGDDLPLDSAVTKVYESGNKLDKNRNGVIDGLTVGGTTYFREGLTLYPSPFLVEGTAGTHDTADVALQRVLDYSGANWQRRSVTDARVMNSVRTGTGAGIPDISGAPQAGEWTAILAQRPVNGVAPFNRPANFDTDNDGLPDTWEIAHSLDPATASNNADFDSDGYRNIEEYINELGAWPAPNAIVFTNTNASGRYAEIGNWGNVWQPSRFDIAQINAGTATIDAPGQHAKILSIASNSGDTAALSIISGWLDIRQTLSVAPGGTGSVTQSGGVLRAGTSVSLGSASNSGSFTLTGGTLATSLLTKANPASTFTFSGGTLHADTVAFSLNNAGGTLAPGSDLALQQIAAASMPDIDNALEPVLSRVGSTRINGDLALQSGALEIDVAGLFSADKLTIDNALTLGGALNVVAADGYLPATGSRWLIASASSISGTFTSITPGYGVEVVNGNSLYLVAISTGGTGSTNVTVAADGSGQYTRLQDALNAVPDGNATPYIIHIKPGTYSVDTVADQFMADAPKITLNGLGGNPANVIITGGFNAASLPNDKYQHATIVVLGNDFTALNVTFANTAGDNQGQALAIYSKADRLSFVNCRFIGWQDTLRAEYGRQYFENCYIDGDVDFIYGHATGYFKNCSINVKSNGYVTAPDTLVAGDYRSKGFVFEGCTITGATNNVGYLGRQWNPGGLCVFLNTKIGPVIRAEGWSGSTAQNTFAEYRSTDLSGALLNVSGRAAGSIQLTDAQIEPYSQNNWLSGPDAWAPYSAAATVPSAPASLTATGGNAQVSLTWPSTAGATRYNVKRSATNGGPYTTVGSPTGTSYTDTGLTNGVTYYYVLSAVNQGGESANSTQASATPLFTVPVPPPVPASLTATAGNAQVSLTWPSVSGATSYNLKRSTVSGGPYTTVSLPTGTSYTNTSLINGTTYYYVVSAVNADGESADSPQASATPQLPPPSTPTALVATSGNAQVSLNWGNVTGATNYNVKRSTTTGGPYTTVASSAINSYTNTGLANGTTYYFVVSAVNGAGESTNSSQASATPVAAPVSQLLAYAGYAEGVTGTAIVNNTVSGGTGFIGNYGIKPTSTQYPFPYYINGLTYDTLKTTGKAVQLGAANNQQYLLQHILPATLGSMASANGGTLWMSYLFYNPVYATNPNAFYRESSLNFVYGASTANGSTVNGGTVLGGVGMPNTSATVPANWAMWTSRTENGSTTTPATSLMSTISAFNPAAQLVVMRMDINPAANTPDKIYLWINPTIGGSTPDISTAQVTNATINVDAINAFRFIANGVSGSNVNAFYAVDEIRVGATFGDVTPVEASLPVVSLVATDAAAGESGADQSLAFTVTRTGSTASALTVPLVASGSAAAGDDYAGFSGSVEIPAGQSSTSVVLNVLPDALAEGSETVALTLGASASFTAGAPSSASASIADSPAGAFFFANIADPAQRNPGDDPEGDGVPNQLEFLLGLNPSVPDSNGLPTITVDADWVTFRFTRSTTADSAFSVQSSTDLINWSVVPTTVESSTATTETLIAKLPRVPGKLFFRLIAETIPTVPLGYLDTNLPVGTIAFGLLFDDTSATPTGVRAARIETLTTDTIGLTGANWSGALANPAAPWAVRFTSGTAEGRLVDITANTTTTLTLGGINLAALGVVAGDSFELVPLDTLGTLFSGALQGGTSAATADVVQLRSGATWVAYYFDTTLGFWRRTSGAAVNSNNAVVRPGSGILVLRRGSATGLTIVGRVLGGSFRQPVNNASSTAITAGFPTDATLGSLGVQTLLTGWRAGTTSSSADAVGLHNGATWIPYYFNGTNWQTAAGANSDSVSIPAGSVLLIQRPGSTSGTTDLVRAKVY
ncbi:MAG: pectinesterase family protein [Nibricoccus sp.]